MTALSNIPPQAVLPLAAYDPVRIERDTRRAGQSLYCIDCAGATGRAQVFERIGDGLRLPAHSGRNLDALNDSLTELPADPQAETGGFVIILKDLPPSPVLAQDDRDGLLDVFREAADYYYDRDVPFRVFYSVQPAQPPQPARRTG